VPDLLCISFSCNDLVGHTWGPDSQEVLDTTLRSDRDVRVLLDELDRSVGKDNYVVAVSADHGVCPLVENLRTKGKDAGRLFAEDVMKAAAAYLNTHFQIEKPFPWFLGGANTWVALNKPAIEDHGLDFVNVERILTEWMGQQEGIAFARSIEELQATTPEKTPFLEAIRRSMYPGRTGDILAVPKEHWFFAFALTGTSHGTPYAYDRHVPVLLYGSPICPGVHEEQVPPQIIAPTFCHVLGLTPAPTMAEPIPPGVLKAP
jgi:predicted AlkP superfamily pyrophosphatase or phosphodiesterase